MTRRRSRDLRRWRYSTKKAKSICRKASAGGLCPIEEEEEGAETFFKFTFGKLKLVGKRLGGRDGRQLMVSVAPALGAREVSVERERPAPKSTIQV